MIVKELIAYLAKFDDNLEVLVDGYEGGYSTLLVKNIGVVRFLRNSYIDLLYMGEHENADEDGDNVKSTENGLRLGSDR